MKWEILVLFHYKALLGELCLTGKILAITKMTYFTITLDGHHIVWTVEKVVLGKTLENSQTSSFAYTFSKN